MPDAPAATLGTVLLGVTDLSRSLAFYRDLVGMTVRLVAESLAFLDGGGVALALRQTPDLGPPGDERRVELVLHVPDVGAAYQALRARGVPFRRAPRQVTAAEHAADFRDPDGHVLSIFGPAGA